MSNKLTKSKIAIIEATRKLWQNYSTGEISVGQICNEAKVHRSTFYTLFEDKYALERYAVVEDLMNLEGFLKCKENDFKQEYLKDMVIAVLDNLQKANTKENKRVYDDNFVIGLERLAETIATELLIADIECVNERIRRRTIIRMYILGPIKAYYMWIKDKEPIPYEELVKIVLELVV